MRILDIMLKDILQILRDKKSLLFLLAMPVVFTIFMGIAMKGAGAPDADPRLPVGWINRDPDGPLSQGLRQMLSDSESIRLVEMGSEQELEANQQVGSGKLAAALVVPLDFSRAALAGENPQIVMVADPVSIVGQSALELVRVPVTRLMSAVEIARETAGSDPAEIQASFTQTLQLWQGVSDSGPQIVMEKAQAQPKTGLDLSTNPYNQSSPGMLVMFAIFGLTTSASILVQERKTRTLERMAATSLGRGPIILGHLLAMFVLIFAQQAILVVFGQIALKVNYLAQPLGTLLAMVSLGLWVASMGLLISVVARSEEQVILYSMAAMFILSALGGAWFPLEGAGQGFAVIGHLIPSSWAMTGFQNILVRGLGSASVLLSAGVQLIYALIFFLLAAWRFRKQV